MLGGEYTIWGKNRAFFSTVYSFVHVIKGHFGLYVMAQLVGTACPRMKVSDKISWPIIIAYIITNEGWHMPMPFIWLRQ
jgi:hypothetical protein